MYFCQIWFILYLTIAINLCGIDALIIACSDIIFMHHSPDGFSNSYLSFRIPYYLTLTKQYPGKIMLSYMPRIKPRHEYISITPDGLRYRQQNFHSLNSLMRWFKEHFRDPIPGKPSTWYFFICLKHCKFEIYFIKYEFSRTRPMWILFQWFKWIIFFFIFSHWPPQFTESYILTGTPASARTPVPGSNFATPSINLQGKNCHRTKSLTYNSLKFLDF